MEKNRDGESWTQRKKGGIEVWAEKSEKSKDELLEEEYLEQMQDVTRKSETVS